MWTGVMLKMHFKIKHQVVLTLPTSSPIVYYIIKPSSKKKSGPLNLTLSCLVDVALPALISPLHLPGFNLRLL